MCPPGLTVARPGDEATDAAGVARASCALGLYAPPQQVENASIGRRRCRAMPADRGPIMRVSRILLTATLALAASMTPMAAQADDSTYTAHLSAAEEVPTNASLAQGQTIFKLSSDGTELEYRLIVANLENPVAAHIHLAPAGENGAVVAFLYGPAVPGSGRTSGVIATGTITADDLVGPLAGQPLSELIEAIEAGNAYVNVHTNDGVAPVTNEPGDIPGGEIRGQVD
jgi:hypothetical protein